MGTETNTSPRASPAPCRLLSLVVRGESTPPHEREEELLLMLVVAEAEKEVMRVQRGSEGVAGCPKDGWCAGEGVEKGDDVKTEEKGRSRADSKRFGVIKVDVDVEAEAEVEAEEEEKKSSFLGAGEKVEGPQSKPNERKSGVGDAGLKMASSKSLDSENESDRHSSCSFRNSSVGVVTGSASAVAAVARGSASLAIVTGSGAYVVSLSLVVVVVTVVVAVVATARKGGVGTGKRKGNEDGRREAEAAAVLKEGEGGVKETLRGLKKRPVERRSCCLRRWYSSRSISKWLWHTASETPKPNVCATSCAVCLMAACARGLVESRNSSSCCVVGMGPKSVEVLPLTLSLPLLLLSLSCPLACDLSAFQWSIQELSVARIEHMCAAPVVFAFALAVLPFAFAVFAV